MPQEAIKTGYQVTQGSTEGMWYEIVVRRYEQGSGILGGVVVDKFLTPTMQEAQDQFKRAGYVLTGNRL
jgi:hypothetical protein